MRNLMLGCVVAALVALSAKTEARPAVFLPLQVKQVPAIASPQLVVGVSSWYGPECQGNVTASGELFDMNGLTAAHVSLPFGTRIKVTNLRNSKSVVLRVNDRGPGIPGRVIDVSMLAAERLGFLGEGLAPVRLEIGTYPN